MRRVISSKDTRVSRSNPILLGLALFLLAVLLLVRRSDCLQLFSSHLLGGTGGDTNLYFWLVTTFPHNLLERGWFNTNAFSPYEHTLAWSDNFLFPSSLFYCLRKLGLAEIPAWNVLILCAQFLNGVAVFLLARSLRANYLTSFFLGSIFIASPYFAEHLGHPQLQFFFFVPLGFLAFLKLLEKPNFVRAFALALALGLAFLTTVYYAIALGTVCILYTLSKVVLRSQLQSTQFAWLIVSALLSAVMLFAFTWPYLEVREAFGPRKLHEFYYFGVSLLSYLSSTSLSVYYSQTADWSHSEARFFWGLASAALLLVGVKSVWKVSGYSVCFALLTLALADPLLSDALGLPRSQRLYTAAGFGWLSLVFYTLKARRQTVTQDSLSFPFLALILTLVAIGPLGFPEINTRSVSVFIPFYELFPGFDALRAISRLVVPSFLFFALSSISLLNRHYIFSLVLLVLMLFETRVKGFPLAPLPDRPAIFSSLTPLVEKDAAFLIAPVAGALDDNNQIISWSDAAQINSSYLVALRDSRPLLMNGYSGQRPKTLYELPRILSRFPSEAALNKLKEYKNLRYLVVLGSKTERFDSNKFVEGIHTLGPALRIVTREGSDFVIELVR